MRVNKDGKGTQWKGEATACRDNDFVSSERVKLDDSLTSRYDDRSRVCDASGGGGRVRVRVRERMWLLVLPVVDNNDVGRQWCFWHTR